MYNLFTYKGGPFTNFWIIKCWEVYTEMVCFNTIYKEDIVFAYLVVKTIYQSCIMSIYFVPKKIIFFVQWISTFSRSMPLTINKQQIWNSLWIITPWSASFDKFVLKCLVNFQLSAVFDPSYHEQSIGAVSKNVSITSKKITAFLRLPLYPLRKYLITSRSKKELHLIYLVAEKTATQART